MLRFIEYLSSCPDITTEPTEPFVLVRKAEVKLELEETEIPPEVPTLNPTFTISPSPTDPFAPALEPTLKPRLRPFTRVNFEIKSSIISVLIIIAWAGSRPLAAMVLGRFKSWLKLSIMVRKCGGIFRVWKP